MISKEAQVLAFLSARPVGSSGETESRFAKRTSPVVPDSSIRHCRLWIIRMTRSPCRLAAVAGQDAQTEGRSRLPVLRGISTTLTRRSSTVSVARKGHPAPDRGRFAMVRSQLPMLKVYLSATFKLWKVELTRLRNRISTLYLIVFGVVRLRPEKEAMDRRSFVTSMLTSVGILAVTVGAANALSAVAPRDNLVSADDDGIENVWWRRRYWRRRYWRRRYWRRW